MWLALFQCAQVLSSQQDLNLFWGKDWVQPHPTHPQPAACEAAQQPEEILHPLQASMFYLQTGGDMLFTALSPGSCEMMLWGPHQSLQNQDRGKQPICAGGTIVGFPAGPYRGTRLCSPPSWNFNLKYKSWRRKNI